MYSGTTLTPMSGRIIGGHQKFDRVARHHLEKIAPRTAFPKSKRILHFEGRKGPDAIKRKSPAKDEPWHFYSPFDDDDSDILELIRDHYDQLVKQLKAGNEERSAFEAAWLAHALVDGLTPAHHYPYEDKLKELRDGQEHDTRDSLRKKIVIGGDTKRDTIRKNWKAWGPKGLMSAHTLFEVGIATMIAPLGFKEAVPTAHEIALAQEIGLTELFRRAAREIAILDMYDRFLKRGWTTKLIWQVRHKLAPTIIRTVTLAWYLALNDAKLIEPKHEA